MILVKIGGGKNINLEYICEDIAKLVSEGEKVVVVHGANALRDEVAEKLGIPKKIITSPSGVDSVYTDQQAIDVFLMTYAGLMNKKITAMLQKYGVNSVGLSGIDGRLWEAKRKEAVYAMENEKTKLITDNLTGKVEKVNAGLLQLLINSGYVPVCCPPAISADNMIVNTDNDFAVAVMSEALKIEKIIMLMEAPGMLRDIKDEKSLVQNIKKEELETYLEFAVGRMKKKILGSVQAFKGGVKQIYWGDGKIKNPITSVLAGNGTKIE